MQLQDEAPNGRNWLCWLCLWCADGWRTNSCQDGVLLAKECQRTVPWQHPVILVGLSYTFLIFFKFMNESLYAIIMILSPRIVLQGLSAFRCPHRIWRVQDPQRRNIELLEVSVQLVTHEPYQELMYKKLSDSLRFWTLFNLKSPLQFCSVLLIIGIKLQRRALRVTG